MHRLGEVASTVHLKTRFHSVKDEVITLNADLDSAKHCHFLSLKLGEGQAEEEEPEKKRRGKSVDANLTDLNVAANQTAQRTRTTIPSPRSSRRKSKGLYPIVSS